MKDVIEPRRLTETHVAYALEKAYSGPFLLPRLVLLFEESGKPTATAHMHIKEDNPFTRWHKHAYPGVMLIEFVQQLGYLIVMEALDVQGLPFMREVTARMKNPVFVGDTIIATVQLVDRKKKFFFFEAEIKKGDGTPILEAIFQGVAIKR